LGVGPVLAEALERLGLLAGLVGAGSRLSAPAR
jgi:hypothetical protein